MGHLFHFLENITICVYVAKNFIKNLLVLTPKKRMTAEEALNHPFLTGSAGEQILNMESMREYNIMRKKIRDEQKMDD